MLFICQGMASWHDQSGLKGIERGIADIAGNIEHRANSKIDLISTDHGEAITTGNIAEIDADFGVVLTKRCNQFGQDIHNGRFACRDDNLPRLETSPHLFVEALPKAIHALHYW